MSEERLAVAIRDAFDSTHVPSPGLEHRVVAAIPWDQPRERKTSMPRLAGAFAATLAALLLVALLVPALLSKLNLLFPGAVGPEPPAYSLAAVNGDSVFVVQRGVAEAAPGNPTRNALLQSKDGGRSWVDRLHFADIYAGMQVFGADGFIWSISMESTICSSAPYHCTAPSQAMTVFRTTDGGATWAALPATTFPVTDAFFVDASHGWVDSSSPMTGPGNEVLYATADGGTTWGLIGPLPQPAPNGQVFGVGHYRVTFHRQANGDLIGWYQGATTLSFTTDGGHSWRPVALSTPVAVSASATNPMQPAFNGQEGILPIAYYDPKGPDNATANRIFLYSSHDGGLTWGDPRPAPAGFAPVGDDIAVSILDSRHVWLTSQSISGGDNVQASPAVARTSDGGITWSVTQHAPRILQMTFGDPSHGFALDVTGLYNVNGILITSDGGATWQRVTVPVVSDAPRKSA
jgi:photosystem II stability/assembly factor-like uncharacterized protein